MIEYVLKTMCLFKHKMLYLKECSFNNLAIPCHAYIFTIPIQKDTEGISREGSSSNYVDEKFSLVATWKILTNAAGYYTKFCCRKILEI